MEMSASDVWQDVIGGVGKSTFLSVPAQAYGACYGKTCFSAVRALFVLGAEREGSKDGFCLEVFLRFPFEQLLRKHVCFMLFLLLYGIQLVDWALRLSLLLSLSGCFCTAFVFVLVFFYVTGSHDTLGEAESSTIERLARNASMASKMVESGVKSCSGWRFLGKTFWHHKFCGSNLPLDWAYTMIIYNRFCWKEFRASGVALDLEWFGYQRVFVD